METKVELQAMGFEPAPVLKAIRAKCLDCSGGSPSEVRRLPIPHGQESLAGGSFGDD